MVALRHCTQHMRTFLFPTRNAAGEAFLKNYAQTER